jgi:hypothetical protein
MQETSTNEKFNIIQLKEKADNIANMYANSGISINPASELWGFIESTREVAKSKDNLVDTKLLFKSLHLERIASSLWLLENEKHKEKYLKDILNGGLDFFIHKPSHAKSILWELDVWRKIRKAIPDSYLEEPDVVLNIGKMKISVPCKKITSENGVSKVLSNAVSQIERSFEFGIVAINIDDLVPEEMVLNARTLSEAADKLHKLNMEFLGRQQRHFLRYLNKSRITAVIVSTSMIIDVHDELPKFNNASQWAIWTVPNLNSRHKSAVEEFRCKVLG